MKTENSPLNATVWMVTLVKFIPMRLPIWGMSTTYKTCKESDFKFCRAGGIINYRPLAQTHNKFSYQ
ncbi:hypothetical protein Q3G72_017352 [Acer saccharum]|nr:hypothetical protein Q3G72_017352 [Acer saccharum]